MKEEQTLADFGCLEGKPCDAWKAAHDQFAGDVLAMNAVVRGLQANLKQAERALEFFIKAEDEAAAHGGLKDCRDNDGGFYQSAWMESLIDKVRTMVSPALSSIRQTGLAAAPDTR